MALRFQYCYVHKVVEQYPSCATGYSEAVRYSKNTQLLPSERPVLWTKKMDDGHTEVRYPGRNDGEMPSYYKSEGYQKTEFNSYQDHQKFCRENGLVNHKAEGIRDEALDS